MIGFFALWAAAAFFCGWGLWRELPTHEGRWQIPPLALYIGFIIAVVVLCRYAG